MRSVLLAIFTIGCFLGGLWLGDLVGDGNLGDSVVYLGRTVAAVLGLLAALGVQAMWGRMADEADFRTRIARDMKRIVRRRAEKLDKII
ncbi:MAG TPA: hypothetical protein VNR39_14945 [Pseudolabrys sp.]|nr:hypothetical protein [Pseudolabrys sp.]